MLWIETRSARYVDATSVEAIGPRPGHVNLYAFTSGGQEHLLYTPAAPEGIPSNYTAAERAQTAESARVGAHLVRALSEHQDSTEPGTAAYVLTLSPAGSWVEMYGPWALCLLADHLAKDDGPAA